MEWSEFFNALFWFIFCLSFLDLIILDGLFTSAIASRIRKSDGKESKP